MTAEQRPVASGFDVLQDPAAMATLAHPTRHRIFALAADEEVSAKELAERLEQPLGRVSYHVRQLADAGLLRVVRRTPRRGATETHYRAVSTLEISDEVVERAGPERRRMWQESVIRMATEDMLHAFENGAGEEEDVLLARAHFVVTPAGRRRLHAELIAFYQRLAALEPELFEEASAGDEPTCDVFVGLEFYRGTMAGERNRPLVMARADPEGVDLDTIPSIAGKRA